MRECNFVVAVLNVCYECLSVQVSKFERDSREQRAQSGYCLVIFVRHVVCVTSLRQRDRNREGVGAVCLRHRRYDCAKFT